MPDLVATINDDLLTAVIVGGFPNMITAQSGVIWNRVATAPTLVTGNGYIIDVAVITPVDLPSVANVNDFVIVYAKGLGQILIRQRIGEQIQGMGERTTLGTQGSCLINDAGGWVFLLYTGGGLWEIVGGFGGNLILS